jgi:hypothetical protein
MKTESVKIGGFYVNEKKGLVREVADQDYRGEVFWRSYQLSNGRPTGDSLICSRVTLARWADREATKEEIGRMRRKEALMKEKKSSIEMLDSIFGEMADAVIKTIPDERLLEEVRRRGLDKKR